MEETSILTFIFFMAAGLVYMISAGIALAIPVQRMIQQQRIPNTAAYVIVVLASVVVVAFLPLLSFIMTGESHALLFISVFATTIISIGVGDALSRSLGNYKIHWFSRAMWSELEHQLMHASFAKTSEIISRGSIFLYPVAIGFGYFSGSYPGEQWTSFFLQTTILLLLIVPWITEFPKAMLLLNNKNVMTFARSRALINNMISSASLFLLLSFMLWEMNWQGKTIELLDGTIIISTSLIAAFFLYFAVCLFAPYLRGQTIGKKWREELQNRRESINASCNTLFTCKTKEEARAHLPSLKSLCQVEQAFILDSEAIKLAELILESEDTGHALYAVAIKDSSPRDPRFRHLGFTKDVIKTLETLESELADSETEEEFQNELTKASKQIEDAQPPFIDNASPWAALILSALIGVAMSMAASTVGHMLAAQIG